MRDFGLRRLRKGPNGVGGLLTFPPGLTKLFFPFYKMHVKPKNYYVSIQEINGPVPEKIYSPMTFDAFEKTYLKQKKAINVDPDLSLHILFGIMQNNRFKGLVELSSEDLTKVEDFEMEIGIGAEEKSTLHIVKGTEEVTKSKETALQYLRELGLISSTEIKKKAAR